MFRRIEWRSLGRRRSGGNLEGGQSWGRLGWGSDLGFLEHLAGTVEGGASVSESSSCSAWIVPATASWTTRGITGAWVGPLLNVAECSCTTRFLRVLCSVVISSIFCNRVPRHAFIKCKHKLVFASSSAETMTGKPVRVLPNTTVLDNLLVKLVELSHVIWLSSQDRCVRLGLDGGEDVV